MDDSMMIPNPSGGEIVEATTIVDLLSEKIIGQPTAISGIASTVKTYQAGLSPAGRPAGIFLLLGPTGTGKTRTVEALAEILHQSSGKVVNVDCGEFQTDHEVAKLIGAPPGYLGHRETKPVLTQERLHEAASAFCDLSIVLFDEIEKAAPAVSRLLLGVLDKATLRLGDNTEVNFEKSLIFLTSNLGAREMMRELQPALGFRPAVPDSSDLTKKLEAIAVNAIRKMYSPEFLNRIDAVITYQPLDSEALTLILDQQIADLQKHVNSRLGDKCFSIDISEDSRTFLLGKGTSPEYGARELKRSIHRHLTQPLATLVVEKKIHPGSTVRILVSESNDSLKFDSDTADRPAGAPAQPRLLVVDDNRDFLRLLSLELSQTTPWGVVTAQSVAEATLITSEQTIDFALLFVGRQDPNWSAMSFDLDTDLALAMKNGGHMEANDPNLAKFKARGGKLLFYHGWADPGPAPANTINYVSRVSRTLGGKQDDWLRLFLMPGVGHCRGGVGPDQADFVAALERWREAGTAPDQIRASRVNGGRVDMSRPLCPYPQVARYNGVGSTNDADNFVCKASVKASGSK